MSTNGREQVAALEPKNVWSIFAEMTTVPRPSKQEEKIRAHVKAFAQKHGLAFKEEPVGNIIINVPATPGHEKAPITVLQAHLDMVCEKNRDTQFDWDRDALRLKLDQDTKTGERIVRAEGTTLGADNGIGAAMALAVATSKDVVHGPLELLLTIDEEAGMTGAKALTPESFKGRRMINLDSEEDWALYIGCAGGCDSNLNFTLPTSPMASAEEACRVEVTGLRGGHSGCDIHEGRANAIRLLTRTLEAAGVKELRIGEFVGGSKRNAIPRESHAVVAGPKGMLATLEKAAKNVRIQGVAESYEEAIAISVQPAASGGSFASAADSSRFLAAMAALPNGVLGMHPKVPGLVQSSNNISTVECHASGSGIKLVVGLLSRSSSNSFLEFTKSQIASIARLGGAEISNANQYPGWEPNPDSSLLETCKKIYAKLFEKEPHIAAIHAGLECGIIGERVGKMDMVSLGPTIQGAHSPEERVFIDSVGRSWKLLVGVLAALA